MRKILSSLLATAGALAAVTVAAPAAHAESNTTTYDRCYGNIIGIEHIRNNAGTIISTVQLWENETRGTVLCARNVHQNGYVGKSVWTTIHLGNLYDKGTYSQYAGAIRRNGGFNGNFVHHGGSDPSNPDRDYACIKVDGRTDGFLAKHMWACWSTQVSR